MGTTAKGICIGCFSSLGLLVLMFVLSGLMINSCCDSLLSECMAEQDNAVDEFPVFEEQWSSNAREGSKVVRIPIHGVIELSTGDSFWGEEVDSATFALRSIKAATQDSEVQAILLEINSPGGGVTDSDIIYNALINFKKSGRGGRKVIVLMGDLCASGGYYIASAADYIMAHPTTTLGSIGVIMPNVNAAGLAEKVGLKEEPIVSGKNKSMGGIFGDLTEEQRGILQEVVDTSYERFVGIVAKGRNLSVGQVKDFADGRVFSAERGKELGLVDGIGYYEDATQVVEKLIFAEEGIHVIRYKGDGFLSGFSSAFSGAIIKNIQEVSILRKAYLFRAGR